MGLENLDAKMALQERRQRRHRETAARPETMLAAHRDQENVVRSHGVSSKKQANAAKTPAFRNDENAPTAFGGKAGLSGPATRPGGNGKLTVKRSQKKPTATPAGMLTTGRMWCRARR